MQAPAPQTQTNPGLIEVLINGGDQICRWISRAWSACDKPFENRTAALAIRFAFFIFTTFAIWMSFGVSDDPAFQRPDLARIFFWHFPCPMIASWLLLQGAWYSYQSMRSKTLFADARAHSTLKIGFLFCLLTMASGIVFSKSEWGAWWQWDPRQTSFLLVILLYGAYFVVRGAYQERDRKAAFASAYVMAATLPAMFLIFVFPRLPQISNESLHPTDSILGGHIKGGYAVVIWLTLIVASVLTAWLYRIQMRLATIEINLHNHELEISRGGAANAPVVRAVRLPTDGGSQGEPPAR